VDGFDWLSLEETREARATEIRVPVDTVRKLDAFCLAELEYKAAADDVHALDEDQGIKLELPSMQVFQDLKLRAEKRKQEKEEKDVSKIKQLLQNAMVEREFYENHLKDLRPRQKQLPKEIQDTKDAIQKLDKAIQSAMKNDKDEEAAKALLCKRDLRHKLQAKVTEKTALDETIEQADSDLKVIIKNIQQFEEKIGSTSQTSQSQMGSTSRPMKRPRNS